MADLSNWRPCALPGQETLRGRYVRLEPYCPDTHLAGLFAAICGEEDNELWAFMPLGPFAKPEALAAVLMGAHQKLGWNTIIIRDALGEEILGMASYMRNRPEHGSTEVGAVTFSRKLQRSRLATEAIYLMAKHVFDDLGYRRFEWKCNNANDASKRAAIRFGFSFEGVFRKDMVVKGQNRDTAWYAITEDDWPIVKKSFETWLDPQNFDAKGVQRTKLTAHRVD
jgi:RimJ/RimL family protein N-acetyltransferase